MLSFNEYIKDIDQLRSIVRYQIAPHNHDETVAEHSFYVAAYVLKLADIYQFDTLKALKAALLHDYSEIYISDVPHPIKAKYKELNAELEKIEAEINVSNLGEEIAATIDEFNKQSTVEGKIIAFADILSVLTYSRYEVKLGNKEYMLNVYNKTISRIKDCVYTLSNDKKSSQPDDTEIIRILESFINLD